VGVKNIVKQIIAAEVLHFVVSSVLAVVNDHSFAWNYGFAIPGILVSFFIYWFIKLLVKVFKK